MNPECFVYDDLPLGHTFSVLTRYYFGALLNKMEHHELDKYFTVLKLLDRQQSKITQQALADKLRLDKVYMVRILDFLDKKGYINRVVNPADRREKWVELTPYGKERLPEIHRITDEMNAIAFEGATREEIEAFFIMLKRMGQNLSALPKSPVVINYSKKKKN